MTSNFAEIESEVQKIEKMKDTSTISTADETPATPSASLQYKTQAMLKEEEKLKNIDPKKAEQMERLGMGMVGHRRFVICHRCLVIILVLQFVTWKSVGDGWLKAAVRKRPMLEQRSVYCISGNVTCFRRD